MRLRSGLALFAALVLTPLSALSGQAAPQPAASARPPAVPTSAFSQRSGLSDLNLSPDGNRIALRAVASDGKVRLAVLDTETRKSLHNVEMPAKMELEWFRWAGSSRIVLCLSQIGIFFGEEVSYTRLFVLDLATQSMSFVGKKDMGIVGDDVLHIDPNGEYLLLSMQRTIMDWPSVWRFPLDGTAEKTGRQVQAPRQYVWDWYADDHGVVRLGIEFLDSGNLKLIYRRNETENFRQVTVIDRVNKDKRGEWSMAKMKAGSDDGWVLEKDESSHYVLKKVNFSTFTSGETVFARPGTDVEEAWFDEQQQLVAAFWSDDRDRVMWFEPELKKLQAGFDKALKGSEVWIGDRSRDRSRMLVWAGRENDPGVWYIYTPATKKLDLFFAEKPAIDPAQMAQPKSITYQARDGVEINGLLTLPPGRDPRNLPLIVLPHGGPYGIHDKLEFDTNAQFLANRGYAVLQPNYRGSGGRGDDFMKLGDGQIGRKMQDDLDDGMDWAVAQGIADPKRVCMVGGSYGGYAALWAVIRNPERYRCATSFAGVTDWNAQLRYDRNYFSRESGKKWKKRVSGTDSRFNLDMVSPVKQVARLTRPVLLVHGERDFRVPFKQYTALKVAADAAGKPLEVLTFADEGHGFDKPANEARWLDALEAFLKKHNPAD